MCARTNELVGFEDLEIPADISNAIDGDYNDDDHEQIASNIDLSDSDDDTSSGNRSTASDVEEEATLGSQKPVAKMILQFF